ncbi:MAG TPA: LacI family transcriptional regulator [Firmicutes bacterium]|nr:LacI family transcriptional regulator [Bacillota bacterium]HCX70641.1 LacI family transcriptional regulator [Bacillota bacterium]
MPVTIKHVAAEAGVSASTVSRVLTGDCRISEPTRQRVLQVMEQLGYHPNAIARSLVNQKSNTIGLVLSRAPRTAMAIPFFAELIGGITEQAYADKHHVLLVSSISREEECSQVLNLFRNKRVEGVIHAASRMDDTLISALAQEGFPFVVIGRVPGSDVPSVNNDNIAAADMAVTHLLDQGYTRIACVGGSPDLVVTMDRLQGYKNALTRRGIEIRKEWVICSESTTLAGAAASEKLLGQADRPDAIFAMDDTLAVGVWKGARKFGINCPEELGIIGFNDDLISSIMEPALSTVRIPIFEMGRQAAKMLIRGIQNEFTGKNRIVPAELVIRQSSMRKGYYS